jgi:hypothetical protein
MLVGLAFFITARTEPVVPAPDKFGTGTSVILYDAPTKIAADEWAKAFVHRVLLERHPEQKLTELKVIPVYERLQTSTGSQHIDWSTLVRDAAVTNEGRDDFIESHWSMIFYPADQSQTATPAGFDPNDPELVKRRVPEPDEWNWNPKKQFYYVFYHDARAFIVRSMNVLLASQPYVAAVKGTSEGDHNAAVTVWPGAEQFQK